jgi:DNA repair exonuclease SbcCD ATPase subunit
MATSTGKAQCVTCGKEKVAYKCEGCSQSFCVKHLPDHHQALGKQLEEIEDKRNLFRETLVEQTTNPQKYSLIKQINQWENNSIMKIQQTADEAKQLVIKHTNEHIENIEVQLTKLTEELKQIREEDDFNEIHLNQLKQKLKELEEQFNNPSNISIQQEQSSLFINKISVIVSSRKCLYHISTNIRRTNFRFFYKEIFLRLFSSICCRKIILFILITFFKIKTN